MWARNRLAADDSADAADGLTLVARPTLRAVLARGGEGRSAAAFTDADAMQIRCGGIKSVSLAVTERFLGGRRGLAA